MPKKIWIDPGHGGTDPGAVGPGGRTEKADNLTFALALQGAFTRQGCQVVMTRTGDTTLTAEQRTRMERDGKCDLAISCHRNAAAAAARGLEVWLHNKAPASYVAWAMDVVAGIEALGGLPVRNGQIPQRAAKGVFKGYVGDPNANYAVNAQTSSPSMLLELGFVTNLQDNAWFDSNHKAAAEAVVRASMTFLGQKYVPGDIPAPAPGDAPTVPDGYKAKYEQLIVDLGDVLRRHGA